MTLPLEDEYSDVLKKARYGLGLSLAEAAGRAGVAEARLAAFESGSARPEEVEAHAVARALGLSGAAFWGLVQGWRPPRVDFAPYTVETVRFPQMGANGYVVSRAGVQGAIVIDPGGRVDRLVASCRAAGGLCAILLTHTHFDHVEALPHLVERFPGVPVVVHERGLGRLQAAANWHSVRGDARCRFGPYELEIWEAPGHSDDGLVILLDTLAFTGDTLFAGSLGRSAQGPATYGALLASARRILSLPQSTRLLPGHGPATTVALEARHNPFLAGEA